MSANCDDISKIRLIWCSIKGLHSLADENIICRPASVDEFKGYSALFENDIYDAIDLIKCCEGRTSYGGPSEASVKKQIELASAQLGAWEAANA